MPRYAVYWAPVREHPLWGAGCAWLGRDAERDDASLPQRHGMSEPRRYGFHATLKAPLELRAGATADGFIDAVAALAARCENFAMPRLAVAWLADFMALRPVEALAADHSLRRLADACVRELEPWRAPHGKPALHVFEHWRFHMTLPDP